MLTKSSKITLVFSLLMIASLMMGCQTNSTEPLQWEMVFDPIEYGYKPVNYDDLSGGAQILALEVFQKNLYLCVVSGDGGQLYRTADSKNWETVGTPGFGYNSVGCNDMTVFNDKLYISLWKLGLHYAEIPAIILRSTDGVTFETVSNSQDGSPVYNPNKLREFNGMLYVTSPNSNNRFELYRSKTGDAGTWELAAYRSEFYLGNDLETYKDMLYAAAVNDSDNTVKILRSSDGLNWDVVVDDAFQSILEDGTNNQGGDFHVHKGKLFFTTFNWSLDPEGNWIPNGGQIYTTKNGTDWEIVMQDGFGDPHNTYISGITTYLGNLYAWTTNDSTGCEVWKSRTGESETWVQVNADGFNYGIRNVNSWNDTAQAVFQDEWYIAGFDGTEDSRIGMVWKLAHP